jgi:hypothetical protein
MYSIRYKSSFQKVYAEESGRTETLFFFFINLFTYAYIVWAISPPCPLLLLSSPHPSRFQAELVLPFSPILLKRRHKQ